MEQMAVEYLANAFWQLPLLAFGAWLLLRMSSLRPATQHRVWLAVLALGLLLPLRGAVPAATADGPREAMTLPAPAGKNAAVPFRSADNELPASLLATSPSTSSQQAIPSAHHQWLGFIAAALSGFVHRVSVSAVIAQWIVGLWLAVTFWGILRIMLAWRAARRLVAKSSDAALGGRHRAALEECAQRVGVKVPETRESDGIAGPVIVGATKPVLLWPKNFARASDDDVRAALCHELAHIRRRDYGMNLLCEMAALPLKWHPATHRVERRIRATREMACDAMAAESMESETAYAECLVRLARSIVSGAATEGSLATGLFNGNVMEERVMRLMRGKPAMNLRAKMVRGVIGATAMASAVALAVSFHLAPAMAQEAPATPPVPPRIGPVTPSAPAHAGISAVPVMVPAPAMLSPSIPMTPAQPVVLALSVAPVAKIAAGPFVPNLSAVVPAPLAPLVLQQAPAPLKPAIPPQAKHSSKPIVTTRSQLRALTPAERARIEKQLADAQERIAEAKAKINSPEFKKQVEDAQAEALKAQTMLNSAEFQKQMADAQKQVAEATAKLNSPEFHKKIQAEIDATINSDALRKQIDEAQAAALRAQTMLNSAEFQKQMADAQKQIAAATARLNSPEFKKRIEEAARAAAQVNSAEFQEKMAEAQKQLDDAMARMRADQQKCATANTHGSENNEHRSR